MALCLVLLIAGLSVNFAHGDYRETWDRVVERDARVLSTAGQHLGRSITLGDRVLRAMRDDWQDPGFQALPAELRQRILFNRVLDKPVFGTILVLDREGRAVADSAPVPRAVQLAQRAYFQAQAGPMATALHQRALVTQLNKTLLRWP
jgi:hypothetical protein